MPFRTRTASDALKKQTSPRPGKKPPSACMSDQQRSQRTLPEEECWRGLGFGTGGVANPSLFADLKLGSDSDPTSPEEAGDGRGFGLGFGGGVPVRASKYPFSCPFFSLLLATNSPLAEATLVALAPRLECLSPEAAGPLAAAEEADTGLGAGALGPLCKLCLPAGGSMLALLPFLGLLMVSALLPVLALVSEWLRSRTVGRTGSCCDATTLSCFAYRMKKAREG